MLSALRCFALFCFLLLLLLSVASFVFTSCFLICTLYIMFFFCTPLLPSMCFTCFCAFFLERLLYILLGYLYILWLIKIAEERDRWMGGWMWGTWDQKARKYYLRAFSSHTSWGYVEACVEGNGDYQHLSMGTINMVFVQRARAGEKSKEIKLNKSRERVKYMIIKFLSISI